MVNDMETCWMYKKCTCVRREPCIIIRNEDGDFAWYCPDCKTWWGVIEYNEDEDEEP